eukprot:TRINITY_DN2565_c0_g1_i1.p1 TRINITY_DN2565_c0_g1~~TRINITY_DN2565_c0_g1_i1.p1  ORF type:complete len:512 (-),score=92.05 TRINITY_DN2565_c0_g1_i1:62-1597(-)
MHKGSFLQNESSPPYPVQSIASTTGASTCLCLLIVGFHHQLGNHVDYVYPMPQQITQTTDGKYELPPSWSHLPFLIMPDGAHNSNSDHCFFTLPSLENEQELVYGVSCYVQVRTEELSVPSEGYNERPTVQKSVCIISKLPLFEDIKERLKPCVSVYFSRGNLNNYELLQQLFYSLNHSNTLLHSPSQSPLPMRMFLRRFKHNALSVLKALVLEKRILIYGLSTYEVSSSVLCLASLVPGLLNSLINQPLNADKCARLSKFGLPLDLLSQDTSSFYPFASLQQMNVINSKKSFLVGTSNLLLTRSPHFELDLLVTIEKPSPPEGVHINMFHHDPVSDQPEAFLDFRNPALARLTAVTPADKKFIDHLLSKIGNEEADELPPNEWIGSNEWLASMFEKYILSFLAMVVTTPRVFEDDSHQLDISMDNLVDFNLWWAKEWLATRNFREWKREVDVKITTDYPNVMHPGRLVEDIGLLGQMANKLDILSSRVQHISPTLLFQKSGLGKVAEFFS